MIRNRTLRWTYHATAAGMIATGLGFILGPDRWQSAPSYMVTKTIAPIDVWAIVFVLVGAFKIVGYRFGRSTVIRAAAAMGGTLCLMWPMSLIAAAFDGHLQGWGAIPQWIVVATVQLFGAMSWDSAERY